MEEKDIGLYIHIPFCKSKCYYCDFVSYADMCSLEKRYIKCLQKDIEKYANENSIMAKHGLEKKYIVKTIYFGGGTPSILDEKYIVDIMNTIRTNFKLADEPEITIEVNPGTITKERLETYYDVGINRLSIGLQAVQDNLLEEIGRIHNYKQFEDAYNLARKVGFSNINVDIMIGLPNQTLNDVKESIKKVIDLKPEHISVYSLILEEGTKLEKLVKENKLEMLSDEVEREMYWYVKKTLEKHKYNQYEISNFAKSGFESKHNLDCWNQKEYIGVGAAASSFLDNNRYSNIPDLEKYILNIENGVENKNLILEEVLNKESKMNEYMMLGLRKIEGVSISKFEQNFNENPITKYCKELEKLNNEGLIHIIDDRIKLTNKGVDLANLVWEEFI